MGNISPSVLVSLFLITLLCCGQTQGAALTIEPNWSTFYHGEFVTFICDMNEGKDTDWEYQLMKNNEELFSFQSDKIFKHLSTGHSAEYQCCGRRRRSDETKCSRSLSVDVFAIPTPKLTVGPTTIPVGGSVTLSCSVERPDEWKYKWWRQNRGTSVDNPRNTEENRDITVTQGGIYFCFGYRLPFPFFTRQSNVVTINIRFSNKVFVTRQPNWPQMFSGETITLSCEVQGGETTEWTCEWKRDESIIHRTNGNNWTFIVFESSSGVYMCQCKRRDDWFSSTQWSEAISLSVSNKPRAKLTAGSTTILEGGSVTLSCSVEPSAGWKYRWFRRTKNTAEDQLTNKENSDITVRQEGIYRCEGERGNPSFYSHSSHDVSIEIMLSNKCFVTQRPNWPQLFSGETISLTCEVHGRETTEWTCEWKRDGSIIHRTNSKDWTFTVSESISGDYMCQCKRGDDSFSSIKWSEAISLSVSDKPTAKLTAGSTTILEGGSVTLSCSVEPSAGWKYRWFRKTSGSVKLWVLFCSCSVSKTLCSFRAHLRFRQLDR